MWYGHAGNAWLSIAFLVVMQRMQTPASVQLHLWYWTYVNYGLAFAGAFYEMRCKLLVLAAACLPRTLTCEGRGADATSLAQSADIKCRDSH